MEMLKGEQRKNKFKIEVTLGMRQGYFIIFFIFLIGFYVIFIC